jgi:putative cardiolipin synthase
MIGDQPSKGMLIQSGQARLAMRFSEPEGEAIVIDGEYIWVYTPSTTPGQVLRMPLPSGGPVYGYNLIAWLLDKPHERYQSTFVRNDRVEGRNVSVVEMIPTVPDIPFTRAVVWLDRADGLPRRIEIHELRPDAGQVRKEWSITGGRSIAALHTKALVVDRRSTFVGSFNLDPRSANINTEVGLLIDSPELAQQVASYLDAGVEADNAYHVTLDARGHTRWSASVDGQVVTYDHEPQTSAWKRFTADVIRILPIDSQL